MSAVDDLKESFSSSLITAPFFKAIAHAEELDRLRPRVAELEAEIERLRRERDALRGGVTRLTASITKLAPVALATAIISDAAIDAARGE